MGGVTPTLMTCDAMNVLLELLTYSGPLYTGHHWDPTFRPL